MINSNNNSYTFNSLKLHWQDTTLQIFVNADSPKTECFLALKCFFEHPDFQCTGLYLVYKNHDKLFYKEKQPLLKIVNLDYAGFICWISDKCTYTDLSVNSDEYNSIKLYSLELRNLKPVGFPTKAGIEWNAELFLKYTL